MAEKDKVEKLLEDYPDVFADIINVLIYGGKQIVKPEELRTTNIQSQYKASDDVLHEEERDTLKEWSKGKDFCKVITLVLHFGNRRWKGDKELQEIIKKQSGEEDWFQNYKLNVFDIAYLTEEQVKMFQSDFGIIADYFVKRRKGYKIIENHQPIKHVDEMLKFMKIFAEDDRFLKLDLKRDEKGEFTMCTILDAAEQRGYSRGEKKGINKGKKLGYKNGQDEILKLVKILIASNRLKDIDRIYEDNSYRQQLMKEYNISN